MFSSKTIDYNTTNNYSLDFSNLKNSIHRRTPTAPNIQTISTRNDFSIPIFQRPIDLDNNNLSNFNNIIRKRNISNNLLEQKIFSDEDLAFNSLLNDENIKFNPVQLNFIPSKFWNNSFITFGEIVNDFFRLNNGPNYRFAFKLYNALQIVKYDPFYSTFLGVEWINEIVLLVNCNIFSKLLFNNEDIIDLFGFEGQFSVHGFLELNNQEALAFCQINSIKDVDFINIKLFTHQLGVFTQDVTEDEIKNCKWIRTKKKKN